MTGLTRRKALGTLAAAIVPLSGCGYRRSLDIAWRNQFDGGRFVGMREWFAVAWISPDWDQQERIEVYDADTGTERGVVTFDGSLEGVVTSGNRCYAVTDRGLIGIDATGERTMADPVTDHDRSTWFDGGLVPVGETRFLYYIDEVHLPYTDGSHFDAIGCYDLSNGGGWTMEADALDARAIGEIRSGIAVGDDVVVILEGVEDRFLVRIGPDGTIAWSRRIHHGESLYRLGDTVVVTDLGLASVVDLETGDERRSHAHDRRDALAVDERYYWTLDDTLWARDIRTGEEVWETTIDAANDLRPVAGDDRGLYLSSDRGSLSVAPSDGELRWFQSGGEFVDLFPSVAVFQFDSLTGVRRQ